MYSVDHNNVFISLVATSFGQVDHQTNTTQYLKRLVTRGVHKFQGVWNPIYNKVLVFFFSIECKL